MKRRSFLRAVGAAMVGAVVAPVAMLDSSELEKMWME